MNRQDRQARTLLLWVVVICTMFFAFALGVWAGERETQTEPEYVTSEPMLAVVLAKRETISVPVAVSAVAEPDPMIEDTYLRDDIPLDYDLQCKLYGACLEFGIEYPLALAVIEQETNFRNVAGDNGASVGYMQIQRRWWSELMADIGAEDLTDPEDNFRTGCAILRQLLDKYESTEDALSAYNTGRPGSTRYSRSVLGKMEKYYG